MAKRFRMESWDIDGEGNAFVVAKDACPNKEDVPRFICDGDFLDHDCEKDMVVEEGWCRFMVRSDWDDYDGERRGGYVVYLGTDRPKSRNGSIARGWFPVWIVRHGDWY